MLKINFFIEKQIINRIKANDRKVLGELFLSYKRLIFQYIMTHGGSNVDAEDILQEAIIVFWQKVTSGKFELSVKIGTYLLAIAKNMWMAEKRKQYRKIDKEVNEDIKDKTVSSLDEMVYNEKLNSIRKSLELIQPICKKLLMFYYFEERSMQEIARLLNFANENVAKSKKYQCKKALKEIIIRQEQVKKGEYNGL